MTVVDKSNNIKTLLGDNNDNVSKMLDKSIN